MKCDFLWCLEEKSGVEGGVNHEIKIKNHGSWEIHSCSAIVETYLDLWIISWGRGDLWKYSSDNFVIKSSFNLLTFSNDILKPCSIKQKSYQVIDSNHSFQLIPQIRWIGSDNRSKTSDGLNIYSDWIFCSAGERFANRVWTSSETVLNLRSLEESLRKSLVETIWRTDVLFLVWVFMGCHSLMLQRGMKKCSRL